MDWDLEIKRLIFDSFSCDGEFFFVDAKINDNRLLLAVSHIEGNESRQVEVVLKPVEDEE